MREQSVAAANGGVPQDCNEAVCWRKEMNKKGLEEEKNFHLSKQVWQYGFPLFSRNVFSPANFLWHPLHIKWSLCHVRSKAFTLAWSGRHG
jgi:hypothetical protein